MGKEEPPNSTLQCHGLCVLLIYVLNFRLRVINRLWYNAIDFPALEVELNVHYSGVGHHEGSLRSLEEE